MTTLTDYTVFESWVLRSYKILKKKHTPPSSLMLTTRLAFVLQQKQFPFELSRLITIPPAKYSSCGWVVQWYCLMSQRLAMKCSVCCQVLQHGKEEILFRGPTRVTRFGVRCGISEGMALLRCENVKHGMCRTWACVVTWRYFHRDSIQATPDSLLKEKHDLIENCFSLFRLRCHL